MSKVPQMMALAAMILLAASSLCDDLRARSVQKAHSQYLAASSNYTAHSNNTTSAWKFARACFEWSEFATNDTQLASLANQGIAAAQAAIALDPENPAGHLYLGLNFGQLARTRLLTALGLVRDMERAFLNAVKVDEKFHYGAAHRSLGMLYTEAPGWPASIGSRSKARKHFERAIELVPDYPDNYLSAMEAYVEWEDEARLKKTLEAYRRILPMARMKYQGQAWEQSWHDWQIRWKAIQKSASTILREPSN